MIAGSTLGLLIHSYDEALIAQVASQKYPQHALYACYQDDHCAIGSFDAIHTRSDPSNAGTKHLEHRAKKWEPVFRKNDATTNS
jgi:hypothetical protein